MSNVSMRVCVSVSVYKRESVSVAATTKLNFGSGADRWGQQQQRRLFANIYNIRCPDYTNKANTHTHTHKYTHAHTLTHTHAEIER